MLGGSLCDITKGDNLSFFGCVYVHKLSERGHAVVHLCLVPPNIQNKYAECTVNMHCGYSRIMEE